MLHLRNLIAMVTCVAVIAESQMIDSSVCTESRHNGHCYGMYLAWYYDVTSQECKEFVYGGCGGNGNRFKTEEDCYTHCTEKLVLLQPPMDVTIAVTQANYVYIFWYAPVNFKFHAPVNESDADIADIYDNPGYTVVNDTEDSGKGDGVSHQMFVPLRPSSSSSTNTENKDAVNGSSSTSTKNNNSDTVPAQTNNTDSANNQTSSSNSDSKQSNVTGEVKTTAKPEVAQTTQESNITANTTNYKIIDFIGKTKVPFHFARLLHYIVSYKLLSDSEWTDFNVSLNQSEYNISGLQPSTEYKIRMSAVYLTNSSINTSEVSVTTRLDPTVASQCSCNEYGTVGKKTCDLSLSSMPWCQCKTGHAGLFCELCDRGHYRTGPSLPCHKCPCTPESSTGSCRLMSGYLHCLKCKEGYAGNLCQRCGNGYYRNKTISNSCHKCTGCHGIRPGLICHPISGSCLNCHYNTSGDRCDVCLPGYKGDPLNNIPCMPEPEKLGMKLPPSGVIASIVVGTIVLLSGIVGVIIYRRIQKSPTNRPFWTIELQDDHESVNFSAIPDDELERHHDDNRFYENVQKNRVKEQPYSRLDEET